LSLSSDEAVVIVAGSRFEVVAMRVRGNGSAFSTHTKRSCEPAVPPWS
jgi:hypothetical protein